MNIAVLGIPELNMQARYYLRSVGAKIEDTLPSAEELKIKLAAADIAVLSSYCAVDLNTLQYADNLRAIITSAVGYNHIDINACRAQKIDVINCPTYNSQSVAELATGLLLAVTRKVSLAQQHLQDSQWTPDSYVGVELTGKKSLIIGSGKIAKKLQHFLHLGFNQAVVLTNSKTDTPALESLLSSADFIFICAALNSQTEKLLNKHRLSLIQAHSYIINVARGAIIDEEALYELLVNKKIAGAGLDVFTNEPTTMQMPADHIASRLSRLPNVVATPHIGYNTQESIERLSNEIMKNVASVIDGNPLNAVN